LKNRKQRLLKQYKEDPLMRLLCEEKKVGSWIDGEIERLQGLLKSGLNSPVLGGPVNLDEGLPKIQQRVAFCGVGGKP